MLAEQHFWEHGLLVTLHTSHSVFQERKGTEVDNKEGGLYKRGGSSRGLHPTKEDILAESARSGMQKSECLPLSEDEVKARRLPVAGR